MLNICFSKLTTSLYIYIIKTMRLNYLDESFKLSGQYKAISHACPAIVYAFWLSLCLREHTSSRAWRSYGTHPEVNSNARHKEEDREKDLPYVYPRLLFLRIFLRVSVLCLSSQCSSLSEASSLFSLRRRNFRDQCNTRVNPSNTMLSSSHEICLSLRGRRPWLQNDATWSGTHRS